MANQSISTVPVACADFSFLSVPHEVSLDLIAGLDFQGVDISLMAGYSHLPVADVLCEPEEWSARVRRMLDSRGLLAADVNFLPGGDFTNMAVNHPDAGQRDTAADCFRRALRFARATGARHMTMLPGLAWPDESAGESFARSVRELTWRVAEAAKAGITLSVEAHVGSIAPAPADASRLVAETEGLTLTLDLTHFVSQGFSQQDCMHLLPLSSHFHARGGAPGKLQATAGENIIDYVSVIRWMGSTGYAGYFEVEYEWNEWGGCNRVDVLAETIQMRNLVRRCLSQR